MYAQHSTKIKTEQDGQPVLKESTYGIVHVKIDFAEVQLAKYALHHDERTLVGSAIVKSENKTHLMDGKTVELYFDPKYASCTNKGIFLSNESIHAFRTSKVPIFLTRSGIEKLLNSEKCANDLTALTRFELELV